ncbi:MAG: hypothetical protein JRI25_00390 [Deltaproteobacteria bacterium]|nr:hypothetical protein [Deltaproteobacteria bacterium]MBW2253036.1 hypothetical protein [Deltaproteobacteria bacterium]
MMTRSLFVLFVTAPLVGCLPSGDCGEADCAAFCAQAAAAPAAATTEQPAAAAQPAGTAKLSVFEADIVAPILEDVRGGVRAFDGEGIGICRGKRTCDEYLGNDVGELPPGDYVVKAELRVPNTGEGHAWSIDFATECETVRTTERGESRSSSQNSRNYEVRYAGEQRGYRLLPLQTITSPSNGGARNCKYTITAAHPDGDKVYTGSWATPDAG